MKIIRALADDAPLTMYAIAKKSGAAISSVHKIVKNPEIGLEAQKIVKVYSAETWRTGLKRIEYILTFRGLVEYFSLLFEERQVERSEVKKAVKKYRQFCAYPVFTEQDFLEDWLGAKVYDLICSTAWILKNQPPYIPVITEGVSGPLPAIIQSVTKGHMPKPIRWEEKILTYAFTLVFFDLIAVSLEEEKTSPTPNSALYKLVDKTYQELRVALERRLKGVEKFGDATRKLFSN